jgi:hypothetical protein
MIELKSTKNFTQINRVVLLIKFGHATMQRNATHPSCIQIEEVILRYHAETDQGQVQLTEEEEE